MSRDKVKGIVNGDCHNRSLINLIPIEIMTLRLIFIVHETEAFETGQVTLLFRYIPFFMFYITVAPNPIRKMIEESVIDSCLNPEAHY